jgi:hypothetical protein
VRRVAKERKVTMSRALVTLAEQVLKRKPPNMPGLLLHTNNS